MNSSPNPAPAYEIERLLAFGVKNHLIDELDIVYTRNLLLDLLHIDEPCKESVRIDSTDVPETAAPILENLLDYAAEMKIIPENTNTLRALFDTRIMGLLMPKPSQIIETFRFLQKTTGSESATDWFYRLNEKSDYIRVNHIAKNIRWFSPSKYGELEITINLSKPEKDPREIAALKNAVSVSYPKCLLCIENVGYQGRLNHPARQNLRVIPLTLHDEKWYFQYSPYVYYHQHCIVFNDSHIPMKISQNTFIKLLEFIDIFPHYFIGSNADLPIVGGSILNHDHFQGGYYQFPMEKAAIQVPVLHEEYPDIEGGIVAWPMSVLRLVSKNKSQLIEAAAHVLHTWRNYSDPSSDILAYTKDGMPHNTITPIARKKGEKYTLDLVLRNNRTDEKHPLGIFHPHDELFHIKKENIGLIEVMGLFILPGRLQNELKLIEAILSGPSTVTDDIASQESHPLHKHHQWIMDLLSEYGSNNQPQTAMKILQDAVAKKCTTVLEHAGVFKDTKAGRTAFHQFLKTAGFANPSM